VHNLHPSATLHVEAFDEEVGRDELIGRADIPLNNILNGAPVTGMERPYSLRSNHGRYAGDLVLSTSKNHRV
jgi:hypothetical protein